MTGEELEQIGAICERLFREADAKGLILSDTAGELIYSVGDPEGLDTSIAPDMVDDEFSIVYPDDDARPNVYGRLIGDGIVLILLFSLAQRVEQVRTAAAKAAELIDFVLRTVKWEPGRG